MCVHLCIYCKYTQHSHKHFLWNRIIAINVIWQVCFYYMLLVLDHCVLFPVTKIDPKGLGDFLPNCLICYFVQCSFYHLWNAFLFKLTSSSPPLFQPLLSILNKIVCALQLLSCRVFCYILKCFITGKKILASKKIVSKYLWQYELLVMSKSCFILREPCSPFHDCMYCTFDITSHHTVTYCLLLASLHVLCNTLYISL